MPDDSNEKNAAERSLDATWAIERRRVLQLAGAGLGSLGLAAPSGVASAATGCADGPFERTVEGATVNFGQIRAEQAREGGVDASPAAARPATDDELAALREAARSGAHAQPADAVAQTAAGPDGGLTVRTSYDGVNAEDTRGFVPSDSQIAAGLGKNVHAINLQVGIYNQQSGVREHLVPLERIWEPVIPEPEGGFAFGFPFVFDPRARYDRGADRFVLCATQFQAGLTDSGEVVDREALEEGEVDPGTLARPPKGWWVVAVSATSDPNGDWHVYRVPPINNEGLVDYPTLGLDRDAVYMAQNFFGDVFEVTMVVLDKAAMYAGEPVTVNHFTGLQNPNSSGITFTVQPSLQPFSGGQGGTYYLVNSPFAFPTGDTLTLWEVTDPVGEPTLECFTVPVDPFSIPPPARQPDTDAFIDTLGTRLMNADFDAGSVWTAHAVQFDWDGDGRAVSAIKWYEVDVASRSVAQSGVFGEPGTSYFLPTVGADGGDAVLTYNVSGPETFVRMDVAGRTADHTPGELEDSLVVHEGLSRYDYGEGDPVKRWGDYNGVSQDPQTGRFWAVSQYSPDIDIPPEAEERDPYHTHIAEVFFDE